MSHSIRGTFALLFVLSLLASPAAQSQSTPSKQSEQQFANYAFAYELGSGVYTSNGRLLQIYTLPISWRYRDPTAGKPGITLLLPMTLGFFDFQPKNIIENGLPDGIDSLSIVPGVALDFPIGEQWHVMPFVKGGVEFADDSDNDARLFSLGNDSEYRWELDSGWRGLFTDNLLYSHVNYRGALPSDSFIRLRNGVEMTQGFGKAMGQYQLEAGGFAVLDWYIDSPTGPVTGITIPAVQLELGLMLGTRPGLKWGRVPIPRVGISYRFAGDISAWRLVLGAPL